MRPTVEYLETLTENARRYILDTEAEVERLRGDAGRLRKLLCDFWTAADRGELDEFFSGAEGEAAASAAKGGET